MQVAPELQLFFEGRLEKKLPVRSAFVGKGVG